MIKNMEKTVDISKNIQSSPLELLSVQQVLDNKYMFYVPAYQRGYRWRKTEVALLIEDLRRYMTEESKKDENKRCPFYCLQSVVVKQNGLNKLEVIDGQQRLTTILIILQALFTIKEKKSLLKEFKRDDLDHDDCKREDSYTIQYATRASSDDWLYKITKAYLADTVNDNSIESNKLRDINSDYYHFIDAFLETLSRIGDWNDFERCSFENTILERTRFIWYNTSLIDSIDSDVDVFDRINATKIGLNNAELIKALLLQEENFGTETHLRDQYAIDWDRIEKKLQDLSFWGFVYSTRHPYQYDTHIEYIFDLLMGKKKEDMDYYYYTFNQYYENYLKEPDRLLYVKKCWQAVQETMLMLEEWYEDKTCFHYIGYLLEYGKELNNNNAISIPYLKELFSNINKDQRTDKLKELVKYSLKDLKPEKLFHGDKGNYVTQVLFLLNIQSEQNRKSETARFSFSNYKKIKESPGWNEEHVASNTDYIPKFSDKENLAYAFFEYFTGVIHIENMNFDNYKSQVEAMYPSNDKLKEIKDICKGIWTIFDLNDNEEDNEKLKELYANVMAYFEAKGDDAFKENVPVGRATKREKDFIWNFALLNATTNMSYGNDIYPLKRKRIMNDEYYIYTPICTRALFEKAYSNKLSDLMIWSRNDAKDYWEYICTCLVDFLPNNFHLPFTF